MSAEVTRELLQTSPVEGMPGWEMRLFLITYPPGADASNHSHPVVGIGLLLEGTMISAFDNHPQWFPLSPYTRSHSGVDALKHLER
jgi:quercetin dioxygenase-like cupin family protein